VNFEVKPVGSVFGKDDEVVRIDKYLSEINVKTESIKTFVIVICMTCQNHRSDVKKKLVVPNVTSHKEAYDMAESQHRLSGEYATQIGVTLFKTNQDFNVPRSLEDCEVKFHNGELWE
jgi:hypothetical protein